MGGKPLWRSRQTLGSWPRFVKRGGLEVLPYFPAHEREGEAAPLLRRNLLILLVQVAIFMASRTLAKNQYFAKSAHCHVCAAKKSLAYVYTNKNDFGLF